MVAYSLGYLMIGNLNYVQQLEPGGKNAKKIKTFVICE